MALVLDHFRSIPQDARSRGQGFSDSVSVLVGCVTTAAMHLGELDDDAVLDLVVRASHRIDEVVQLTSWLSTAHPGLGQHAMRDALSALKIALGILEDTWSGLPLEDRQDLLEISLRSLARFCYLFRPAGACASEVEDQTTR